MKKSEFYQNLFPLEDLLPKLQQSEIYEIIRSCDYNIEASQIAKSMGLPEVNESDAFVFFQMGYQKAFEDLNKKLIPINKSCLD